MEKDYFIGLDIGTNSCGYAITDENYNILKLKGKKAWGTRLFEEANTAEERRQKRTNRRRLARKKMQIKWLQEIFKEEIDKVDGNFLSRLRHSSLWQEDKLLMNNALVSKDSLFYLKNADGVYNDKKFYEEYKTLFHLRKELIEKPAKDIRFLYLAIHNIIKNRGHFLSSGDFEENSDVTAVINNAIDIIATADEEILQCSIGKISQESGEKLVSILRENKGLKATKEAFYKEFNAKDKVAKDIVSLLVDGKTELKKLFPIDAEDNLKISFEDENYDINVLGELEHVLSEQQFDFIDSLKQAYSVLKIKKLLGNNHYICESMVDLYDKHHAQLAVFKKFVKEYYPGKYKEIFKKEDSEKTNYPAYIDKSSRNGGKIVVKNKEGRGVEGFYKNIKGLLSKAPEIAQYDIQDYEEKKENILKEIESMSFLPKQRTKANAILPNKLYESELRKILQVNSEKFEFLNKIDDSGLSNADKILRILTFRVPYYVGPIGSNKNAESNFGWAVKTGDCELKPWTLDKIVDLDKSEDAFIKKMSSNCTYLPKYDVLAKNSLLYSEFCVLNELNNLTVNGLKTDIALKKEIFENLFKKYKKVTISMLVKYLIKEGYVDKSEEKSVVIGGIGGNARKEKIKGFSNSYSSYIDMCNVLGKDFVDENIDTVEKIIMYATIISDKARLQRRLTGEFSGILTQEQIKQLKGITFSGWGNLSKEFLQLEVIVEDTGEIITPISVMREENLNLQQVLGKYGQFKEKICLLNKKDAKNITYQDVADMYCSPSVKRGVWQSLKIVQEITELTGRKPKKIFVEVTREEEKEKSVKISRKDSLLELYNGKEFKAAVEKIGVDLKELLEELNKTDNGKLRSEKLYLYFMQMGKCAYSEEPIDLTYLYDENYYDVDHIIPQSKIKNDSLSNKVLVKSHYNKLKSDSYPIYSVYPDWVEKRTHFWQQLKKLKMMDETKYQALTRKHPLTEDELGDFIARQLVETNQSAKAVIELLQKTVENPRNIVYSKARNVSEFRNKYKIVKCREVNDLHHAKDAYLNIVVGNVLFNRFTDNPRNFVKSNMQNKNISFNAMRVFDGTVVNMLKGTLVWNGKEDIARIKNECEKNDCIVSTMSFSNSNGAFYDESIYKSLKNDVDSKAKIPLKGDVSNPLSNVEKYGGYNSMKNAYFMLIESKGKKGNRVKTIESVPVYAVRKYIGKPDYEQNILRYVAEENSLEEAKVLIPKINFKSTLKIGAGEYLLAGKTGDSIIIHNANQWFLSNDWMQYVNWIVKYIKMKREKKENLIKLQQDKAILSQASKQGNTEVALTREKNLDFYDIIIKQLDKDIYKETTLSSVLKKKLQDKKTVFEGLSVLQQAELLYNVIRRVSTGATAANLTLLQDSPNVGIMTINKDVTGKDLYIVCKSTSGIMHKTVKI